MKTQPSGLVLVNLNSWIEIAVGGICGITTNNSTQLAVVSVMSCECSKRQCNNFIVIVIISFLVKGTENQWPATVSILVADFTLPKVRIQNFSCLLMLQNVIEEGIKFSNSRPVIFRNISNVSNKILNDIPKLIPVFKGAANCNFLFLRYSHT